MKRHFIFFLLLICIWNVANAQATIFQELKDNNPAPRVFKPVTAVLGAFPPELVLLQAQMTEKNDTVIQRIHFIRGLLHGKAIVLAQTGIGKVNAAMVTTLLLEHFQPRELVFSGIAGGVNPGLSPGDLVIATRVAYHDYGTITPDSMKRRSTRNSFTMQENPEFFTCDSSLVKKAIRAGNSINLEKIDGKSGSRSPHIIPGIIVTGDVFVSSSAATATLRKNMQADATEMEGAAIAQICWQQQTPFIIIRSLSDDAGNHASMDVKSFYELAARNSAKLVMKMVEGM